MSQHLGVYSTAYFTFQKIHTKVIELEIGMRLKVNIETYNSSLDKIKDYLVVNGPCTLDNIITNIGNGLHWPTKNIRQNMKRALWVEGRMFIINNSGSKRTASYAARIYK